MIDYAVHPIVVGIDETPMSQLALRHGIEQATLRQRSLGIVHACDHRAHVVPATAAYPLPTESVPQYNCEELVGNAIALAGEQIGPNRVSGITINGHPRSVLVDQSYDASLMIIGTRGHGATVSALLGAVGSGLIAHCRCPLMVARPYRCEPIPGTGVVVGVDGSAASEQALGYAFDEASLRDLPVVIVHCWEAVYRRPGYAESIKLGPPAEQEQWLEQYVSGFTEKYPAVPVVKKLPKGEADTALIHQSLGAPMLVVGSRGRGGRIGLFLGSVSQSVLHQAYCPVTVVKGPDQPMSEHARGVG